MDLMDYRRQIIASSPHLSHAEGAVASFADGTDLPLKNLLVNIEPVQSGSGDPSPSNERPISGWSAANVAGTGKNLVDVADATITSQRTIASNLTLSAGTYTVSIFAKNNTSILGYFILTSGGAVSFVQINIPSNANSRLSATFTLEEKTTFNIICNGQRAGYNYAVNDIMIERGSTATEYTPYIGTSITVQLGRTVYGGTLNPLMGELVVDMAIVDLGTLTWTYSSVRDFFYVNLTDIKYRADMISSMYKSVGIKTDSQMALEPTGTIGQTRNSTEIKIRNTDYTDATAFKTAMSGVMLVYELATPQTYTLDPQTVRSLAGQNNIFADTGNVALDYWAHP